MKPKQAKLSDPEQSQRFRDMARELKADESPEAFKRILKKIAPQKPDKSAPKA